MHSPEKEGQGSRPVPAKAGRLLREIEAWILGRKGRHFEGGRPWLLGFSHGPDSTLLCWILDRLVRQRGGPGLLALHVNHGLRPEAGPEAERALSFCRERGIACRLLQAPLPGRAGETRARRERYRLFAEAAREARSPALFLAHHRDDDLETLLFRWMRGTGPLGLAGIPEERELPEASPGGTRILRPLLAHPRAALHEVCSLLGLPHVADPTNLHPGHTARNRIRKEILPALRRKDPSDRRLLALLGEARALRDRVRAEVGRLPLPPEGSASFRFRLGAAGGLSPWAGELYWTRILDRLGQPRPSRPFLREILKLHHAEGPGGKRVESKGRWRAERRRGEIRIQVHAFAPHGDQG